MINHRHINNFRDEEGNWFLPNSRAYFDAYSDQYKHRKEEDKLETLAFLIANGMDLVKIVRLYENNHSDYIIASLNNTLLFHIQFLRWGEMIHWTNEIMEDVPSSALAQTLESELKLCYRGTNQELIYSRWNTNIEEALLKRVQDKKELKEILLKTDFSKEFIHQ